MKIISRLCVITLAQKKLHGDRESVDELSHDLEHLLDKASPGLLAKIRDRELKYHAPGEGIAAIKTFANIYVRTHR